MIILKVSQNAPTCKCGISQINKFIVEEDVDVPVDLSSVKEKFSPFKCYGFCPCSSVHNYEVSPEATTFTPIFIPILSSSPSQELENI